MITSSSLVSELPTKAGQMSWDSTTNNYHLNGFEFTCMFDRCFLYEGAGPFVKKSIKLMGNDPIEPESSKGNNGKPNHFLSDHFGLLAEFTLGA